MPTRTDDRVRCSFCGKTQDQVRKLIAGSNNVFICDECIELCGEILAEELEEEEENGNEEGFYEPSDDNDCCEEEGCHCHDDDCHCHEDGCHCHDDE